MIISIDWLKDFIDIEETPEELSNMLSSLGLEAECDCLLYTSPSPRDAHESRMPSSA